jgi:hypothetical protein
MIKDTEKLCILIDNLKDNYKENLEFGMKVSLILLIVIGWFVANNNPLPMLCDLPGAAYGALLFVFLGEAGLIWFSLFHYKRATKCYAELMKMSRDSEALFEQYGLTWKMLTGAVFGHFVMMLGVFGLILSKYILHGAETCSMASMIPPF